MTFDLFLLFSAFLNLFTQWLPYGILENRGWGGGMGGGGGGLGGGIRHCFVSTVVDEPPIITCTIIRIKIN